MKATLSHPLNQERTKTISDAALKDFTKGPQQTKDYPEAFHFGIVRALGLYIRYGEGIELDLRNIVMQQP